MPDQVAYIIREKSSKELLHYTMKASRKVCTESFFEDSTEAFKEQFECIKITIKY